MKPNTTHDPLDLIAQQAEQGTAADATPPSPEDQQQAEQAAQASAAMEAGAAKVILGIFKAIRALIARKLPEIRDEWPDDLLQAPADAAIPLLREHMARLMETVGANPNAALMAFALLPLVMGYLAALDKQEANAKKDAARTVDDGAQS